MGKKTNNSGNWIQNAIKKPGSFTAMAKKAGGIGKSGKIKESFIKKAEKSKNPTTRKRAQLAETLRKINKRGK